MTTTQQTIDALGLLRDAIIDEVNAMPMSKTGSAWHLDRIAELRRINAAMDRA